MDQKKETTMILEQYQFLYLYEVCPICGTETEIILFSYRRLIL
jgi:hypothetical protein